MEIVERLIAYREYTGLTNSQFADKAGIPRPTLSQFLNGRNKRLSDDMTAKLHQAYPDLNIMWLLFGEGEMLHDGSDAPLKLPDDATAAKENTQPDLFSQPEQDSVPHSDSTQNEVNYVADSFFPADDNENYNRSKDMSDVSRQKSQPISYGAPLPADPAKKIQSIMVFYTDNSYEIFMPK